MIKQTTYQLQFSYENLISNINDIENSLEFKRFAEILNLNVREAYWHFKQFCYIDNDKLNLPESDFRLSLIKEMYIKLLKPIETNYNLCNICLMIHNKKCNRINYRSMNRLYKLLTYKQCKDRIKKCMILNKNNN